MSGVIPLNIGAMYSLQQFKVNSMLNPDFVNAGLSGSLPESLGNLLQLEEVDVRSNLLTGVLPTNLGRLEKLRKIDVRFNRFSGAIPDEVSNWKNTLEEANFSNNIFSGAVPAGICGGPNLEKLIADCDLECSCCTECQSRRVLV
jgi:Leucine-rich repeat (LRR) protein